MVSVKAENLEAELCGFDGCDVAAWTGTHHCHVCIDYSKTAHKNVLWENFSHRGTYMRQKDTR